MLKTCVYSAAVFFVLLVAFVGLMSLTPFGNTILWTRWYVRPEVGYPRYARACLDIIQFNGRTTACNARMPQEEAARRMQEERDAMVKGE